MSRTARKQINGRITSVNNGQPQDTSTSTTSGNGVAVHLPVTSKAVDGLARKSGDEERAVIKASDMMVANQTGARAVWSEALLRVD